MRHSQSTTCMSSLSVLFCVKWLVRQLWDFSLNRCCVRPCISKCGDCQPKGSTVFFSEMKGHYSDAGGFRSCWTPQSFRGLGVRSLETLSSNCETLLCLQKKSWIFSIVHLLVLADYRVPTHHALYPPGKWQGRYLSRTFSVLGKIVL